MKIDKNFKLVLAIIIILLIGSFFYYKEKGLNPEENKQAIIENENPDIQAEGRYIGYIKEVSSSDGKYSVTVDFIQFLNCSEEDYKNIDCPNGFKIINADPLPKVLPIPNSAVIKMHTFRNEPIESGDPAEPNWNSPVSPNEFKGYLEGTIIPDGLDPNKNPDEGLNPYTRSVYRETPFWITFNNGLITEISQQYLP